MTTKEQSSKHSCNCNRIKNEFKRLLHEESNSENTLEKTVISETQPVGGRTIDIQS